MDTTNTTAWDCPEDGRVLTLLMRWQELLRLQDWDIIFTFKDTKKFIIKVKDIDIEYKEAEFKFCDTSILNGQDLEEAIIYGLLKLYFNKSKKKKYKVLHNQGLNILSNIIYEYDKKTNKFRD